ncbi:putative peptidyl-prolyl cis-trans isomerase [Stieleria bergensis]|uniref:peptidylprolyl isomerase n=2 Tax=Stieleria bergensis TaxID=2528025 RepID=A0A517SWA1_9BACT|nr:putative peptidyl-prolyl cis-trans isomerase [Planctomycetes bacterium SV_7m_r]
MQMKQIVDRARYSLAAILMVSVLCLPDWRASAQETAQAPPPATLPSAETEQAATEQATASSSASLPPTAVPPNTGTDEPAANQVPLPGESKFDMEQGKVDQMTQEQQMQVQLDFALKQLKERTPEDQETIQKLIAAFNAETETLREVTWAMREQHTLYVNGYIDDKAPYLAARDAVHAQMEITFESALDLVTSGFGDPYALQYILVMVKRRYDTGLYDYKAYIGSRILSQQREQFVYVLLTLARAAIYNGAPEEGKRIYQNLEEEMVEDIDRRLFATAETISEQYKQEIELIRAQAKDLPEVKIKTTRGDFTVQLFIDEAPETVAHFITLCEEGAYDGNDFYSVKKEETILTGDPAGDGSTEPDQFIPDEHERETTRMPLAGSLAFLKLPIPNSPGQFVKNSAGTQFAILLAPIPSIIKAQTVFGRVVEGMEVVTSLRQVDPKKEKSKNEISLPNDRIISVEVINRPEQLPKVNYLSQPG